MSGNSKPAAKKAPDEALTATDAEKLATLLLAHKTTQVELEQTLLVNSDLQNRIEELELKLANKGEITAPVEVVKPKIPEKSFTVKFDGEFKKEHGIKDGSYVFTIPKFTNPLDNHSVITAEEALTNKELLQHLVKEGFGGIVRKGAK